LRTSDIMPIDFAIDHERRLVTAKARGTLTHEDILGYQKDVWSRPEVNGYDELVDMSQVAQIALQSIERVRELAKLSAGMDISSSASRFAIVATTEEAFGLGRMYQTYRGLDDRSTKEVGVFRSLEEALAFLKEKKPA
jgi:hypothetical protein